MFARVAAITMQLALFKATLNLPWRLRERLSLSLFFSLALVFAFALALALSRSFSLFLSLSGDSGNTKGTRNSNKLLAVPVPAVLKYLGGESLRGMATMQVTGCSTQPPKLKRVYVGPVSPLAALRGVIRQLPLKD